MSLTEIQTYTLTAHQDAVAGRHDQITRWHIMDQRSGMNRDWKPLRMTRQIAGPEFALANPENFLRAVVADKHRVASL
jgi:hypothetical protein